MYAIVVCKIFKDDSSVSLSPKGSRMLWGVVAVPASETSERQKNMRSTIVGFQESHRICPETSLAAMGLPTTLVSRRVLSASIGPNIRRGSTPVRVRSLRDLHFRARYAYSVATETRPVRTRPRALQGIRVADNGRRIEGICEKVPDVLHVNGYEDPVTGDAANQADSGSLVSRGALEISQNLRADQ